MKTIKLGTLEQIGRQWNGANPTKQPILEQVAEIIFRKMRSSTGRELLSDMSNQAAAEVINLVLAELPEDETFENCKDDNGVMFRNGHNTCLAEMRRRLNE